MAKSNKKQKFSYFLFDAIQFICLMAYQLLMGYLMLKFDLFVNVGL